MRIVLLSIIICIIINNLFAKAQHQNVLNSKKSYVEKTERVTVNGMEIEYQQNAVRSKFYPIITATPVDKLCNGWIQIIDTNSNEDNGKWKHFIDYNPEFTKYPFYSYNRIFYDAPQWTVDENSILQ
ncbi:MAG: hypothetical protein RL208_323 [Pseudomonadota bacterium]|jgi:hypothetical protein